MSSYRVVLMAYPPSYRRENGSEMTDTVNELTDGGWSIRQSASLALGGLRTRSRHATRGSSRKAWESGARLGLLVWLMMLFASSLTYGFRVSVFDGIYPPISLDNGWLLPLAAILAMMISTRWWVALIVTSIWVLPLWTYATSGVIYSYSYVQVALPLLGMVVVAWWLAVATDGRRAVRAATGISLLVATTVVASVVASVVADSVGFGWTPVHGLGALLPQAQMINTQGASTVMAISLAVLVIGGLLASTADPRVATTGAVYASLFLPLAVLAILEQRFFGPSRWFLLIVFGLAFALAAAASQVGMKRLARM
jgi:hypothetical protein